MERRITDNISELKRVLPTHITRRLEELGHIDELLEVVLDLGRVPTARYLGGEVALSDQEVTRFDLDAIVENIGTFDTDNRAGIERTLHRISAIRNRRGDVVGLTCRVGRAVYGTIDIIQDLVESGQSLLILGPPGVGKTTILRESARVLAENRRVVIVDTSNEIGGDGDVPHPAVGRARRMQVRQPELQHEVMIEAVENHNPEVIVIDEIGRELEALAARTIAERGVQLIGTAHGTALENLMLNPTLSDLIGGIHAVTLSDDEARRRGTQKTVLERKSPPTFDVLIEIQTRDRLIVHEDVSVAVDALLRGKSLAAEARFRTETGEVMYEPYYPEARALDGKTGGGRSGGGGRRGGYNGDGNGNGRHTPSEPREGRAAAAARFDEPEVRPHGTKVFAYGVARNRLQQAGKRLHVAMTVVDEVAQADAIVTLKNYYRRRPKLIVDAERRGTPIYVLRANTMAQMEGFLADMFNVEGGADSDEDPFEDAMREVRAAILQVQNGSQFVDLTPQDSHIRRLQHQMARKARLESESHGEEPERRVRVTRRPA
ncbi:MAG: R3H domain-containing nucleic acid-binding protein [Chloroflexota bacterium]|nr:R3H domain-containing nucleic acid-binding protein [Chloroflexota bacterium]